MRLSSVDSVSSTIMTSASFFVSVTILVLPVFSEMTNLICGDCLTSLPRSELERRSLDDAASLALDPVFSVDLRVRRVPARSLDFFLSTLFPVFS